MPELEKKKELLKSIRDFHQPLDVNDMKSHARAYSQKRAETIQKHKIEREQKLRENINNYKFSKHKSVCLSSILDQETYDKENQLMQSAEKSDLYAKMKNYGQLVQQMHKPVVSRKKQIEVELNKAKLKHAPRGGGLTQGNSYDHLMPNNDSSERSNSPANSIGKSEYRSYFSENRKLKPIRSWRENEMLPKQKVVRKTVVEDYLLKKRIKNDEISEYGEAPKSTTHAKSRDWKNMVKDMDQKDKVDFLIQKAKAIEEQVEMKDKQNKYIEFDSKVNEE